MLGVTNLLDVELSVEQASIAESLVPSPDLEPTVWRNDRLGVEGHPWFAPQLEPAPRILGAS